MYKDKIPTRNMRDVSFGERTSQLWLNVDDVLERISVSRSQLFRMVKDGRFNPPYKWKGIFLWTLSDIKDFIDGNVNKAEQPKDDENDPITWDAVIDVLKRKTSGLSNKEIAFLLNANQSDTSMLTRLMAKAGVLRVFTPMGNRPGSPCFYTIAEKDT